MMLKDYLASEEDDLTLELTALIDVVFILLIFFAVTTSFTKKQDIPLDLPDAKATVESDVVLAVSIDKEQRIYLNGKAISKASLARRVKRQIKHDEQSAILLKADQQTEYAVIISVLDTIRQAGAYKIALQVEQLN